MGIPQIIFLILAGIDLGIAMTRDGEYKRDKYSFAARALSYAVVMTLLIWGGFFS